MAASGALSDILGLAKETAEGPNISNDVVSGVQAGVQLATAKEQVEQKQQQVAEQKLELQTKQASAMINRTKAAMFANSPAAFETIMKSNENYANSIGVPYNADALRAAWKDPDLKLAAQKEINTVLQGGVSKNPQAIIDYFGQQAPEILAHLQDASYSNAQKQVANDQATKIHAMDNATDIQKAQIMAAAQQGKQADRNLLASNRLYLKEVAPTEELLQQADKTKSIIQDIRNGGITANPNIKADIEDTLSSLSSGKTTVSGSARHELDSYYGKISGLLNKVKGSANGIIAQDQLDELARDVDAFNSVIAKQNEIAFKSFIAKQPASSRAGMISGYNEKRSGYGLNQFGGSTPASAPAAPAESAPAKGGFDIQKFQDALKRNGG